MTYDIHRTDGVQSISIADGQLNGPTGSQAGSDLDLYGLGTLNWGAGVDRNQLRMLENFACEAVSLGGTPTQYRPANEGELGSGNGINYPIKGQLWYNTTDGSLYVCQDSGVTNTIPYADPVWAVVSAGNLFLPITGGALTGDLEIASGTATRLILTSSGQDDDDTVTIEFRDNQLKGFVQLDQEFLAAGEAHPETGLVQNVTTDVSVDHLVIRKTSDSVKISEIRLTDQAIITSGGIDDKAGQIRTPSTVATDDDSTLTTKDYVDASITAAADDRLPLTGGTLTGTLRIEIDNADDAQMVIENTNSSGADATLYFDIQNSPVANIRATRDATDDYFILTKRSSSNVITNYIAIHDGYIETKATTGNIRTPLTVASDVASTLTTKSYVDAAILTSISVLGTEGLTGSYQFGSIYDDVRITDSVLVSTNTQGNRTTIDGNTIILEEGTDVATLTAASAKWNSTTDSDFSSITPSDLVIKHTEGSAQIHLASKDDPGEVAGVSLYQGSYSTGARRGSFELRRSSATTAADTDQVAITKYAGNQTVASAIVLGDDAISVTASVINVNGDDGATLNLNQGTGIGDWGVYFYDANGSNGTAPSAGIIYDDSSGTDQLVIRHSTSGVITDVRLQDDRVEVTDPIVIISSDHIEDVATAQRTFRQDSAPSPSSVASVGDFWYKTNTNALYVRRPVDWALVTTATTTIAI